MLISGASTIPRQGDEETEERQQEGDKPEGIRGRQEGVFHEGASCAKCCERPQNGVMLFCKHFFKLHNKFEHLDIVA